MIDILIVDDHPVIRTGLRAIFDSFADLNVVAEAESGEQAVAASLRYQPDVVLMDLNLGSGVSGADAVRQILAEQSQPPGILVLTNTENEANIMAAVEAGATGYHLKDAEPQVLAQAVRLTAIGQPALTPTVAGKLLDRTRRAPHEQLTAREREIVQLVADGRSNRDIAAALHIEAATVKAHLTRTFAKLDVSSRTAAVAKARSLGII